jgi:hypothetical protein
MTQLQINTGKLEQLYTFKNRDEILAFLTPDIIGVLLVAPTKIQHYFPSAPLSLELYTDHEDANWKTLFLSIGVKDYDGSFDTLEKFWEDWWFDVPIHVRDKMNIHAESLDEF